MHRARQARGLPFTEPAAVQPLLGIVVKFGTLVT
jgi:hypothetical protein